MPDWTNREYKINKKNVERITKEEMWCALRTDPKSFSEKERYIRDCFDIFFGTMQSIEHYISINLINPEDVKYPFNYYAGKLAERQEIVEEYLQKYEFQNTLFFLARLENWKQVEQKVSS